MTTNPSAVDQAEDLVRQLARELTHIRDGECLCCYLWRQLDYFPCDGTHRLALRYQEARAPRATALLSRLKRLGACCCDCELFMNRYQPHQRFWTPEHEDEIDGVTRFIEAGPPNQLPACAGVNR